MKNLLAILFILHIEIYGADFCGYCKRAEHLLINKGLKYTKYDVAHDKNKKIEMYKRTGYTSIPQIFINNKHIGGCSELFELDKSGKLDKMITNI